MNRFKIVSIPELKIISLVKLQMNTQKLPDGPSWKPPVKKKSATGGDS